MDSQPGTLWGREPAMVLALVQAVIALVVAFGLSLAPDQIGAILAVTAVILGLITRSPRICVAQAAHASPLYQAYRRGFADFTAVPARTTLASAIRSRRLASSIILSNNRRTAPLSSGPGLISWTCPSTSASRDG